MGPIEEGLLADLPQFLRFVDLDLGFSVEVPAGWGVTKAGVFPLQIFAPEEKGYRASLAISKTELDPPTEEHFDALMEHLYRGDGLDLEGYELIYAKRIDVQNALAHLAHYEWSSSELGGRVTQVDAMILGGNGTFHKIHGFSLRQLEVKYVPVFLHMISTATITAS